MIVEYVDTHIYTQTEPTKCWRTKSFRGSTRLCVENSLAYRQNVKMKKKKNISAEVIFQCLCQHLNTCIFAYN